MKKTDPQVFIGKPVVRESGGLPGNWRKPIWNHRFAVSWFMLLMVLLLAMVAAERLRARIVSEVHRGSPRAGWYLQSGQWLADIRTISAACRFVMENDSGPASAASAIQLSQPDSDAAPNPAGVVQAKRQARHDS